MDTPQRPGPPQYPSQPQNPSQPQHLNQPARPLWKKKRFLLPAAAFGLFGFMMFLGIVAVIVAPPESEIAEGVNPETTTTPDPSQDERPAATEPSPTSTNAQTTTEQPETTIANSASWEQEIEAIVNSDSSKFEKADQAERLANEYPLDRVAALDLAQSLADEFTSGTHITRTLQDEEYALRSIFLARSVDKALDDSEQLPADDFAFDFKQTTRDLYRGTEEPGSQFISANEDQIKRAIAEGPFN